MQMTRSYFTPYRQANRRGGAWKRFLLPFVIAAPISLSVAQATPDAEQKTDQTRGPEADDETTEAIEVTGTRTPQRRGDSPVATEVISREEIERSGVTDVGQLMATMGGAQLDRNFAGAGVSLQGLEAKHTLVLVDGDRVLGMKDGIVDLERFNAEQIERIEIVRGAGSALYGADAIGGQGP